MAPACFKNEDVTIHPGVHTLLCYDGRNDWSFGVRVDMWSIGSLSGKGGDICE